ncbi:hypothetical protein ABPG77_007970 [Micractinium sp. CCAP 211/92]
MAAETCEAEDIVHLQERTIQPGATYTFSQRWVRSFDTPSFSLDASSGYAYVLEREHSRVQAFKSADGSYILSWGRRGSGKGETFQDPRDLAGTDDGSMIVLDKCGLKRFNPATGEVIKTWGSCGSGKEQFVDPVAMAADRYEKWLHVLDAGARTVRRYSTDGELLGSWATDRLEGVADIAVGADGGVYAAQPPSATVLKFDPAGRLLATFGSRGSGNGQFEAIAGIAADAENNVFVLDSALGRVSVFTEQGDFLTSFGARGSGDGQLARPTGIDVSQFGEAVFVVDDAKYVKRFELQEEQGRAEAAAQA